MSSYSEAKRLAKMCVDDEGNPPASYSPELAQYIGLAQACATLAVADELKRLNEGRDSFHREVLEVLTQAKGTDPGPCPNGGPSTGTGTYTVAPCRLRAGHKGMHEAEDGMAWTGGVSAGATFSEGPSGAGAAAQVVEKPVAGSTAREEASRSHIRQRSPYVNDDASGVDL